MPNQQGLFKQLLQLCARRDAIRTVRNRISHGRTNVRANLGADSHADHHTSYTISDSANNRAFTLPQLLPYKYADSCTNEVKL